MDEPNNENIDMERKNTDSASSMKTENDQSNGRCFNCLPRRLTRRFKSKSAGTYETSDSAGDVKSGSKVNPAFENDPTPVADQPSISKISVDKPKDDNTALVVNTAITTSVDIAESKNDVDSNENNDISVTGTDGNSDINMDQTVGSMPPTKPDKDSSQSIHRFKKDSKSSRPRSMVLSRPKSTISTISEMSVADSGYESQESRRGTIVSTLSNTMAEINEGEPDVTTITATIEGKSQEHMMSNQNPDNVSNQPKELERILTKLTELSRGRLPEELARKRISLPNKFAAAFLTKKGGGYLSISVGNHKRASLFIPPEALSQDDPQLVYMYIPPSLQTPANGTQSKEARVTPTVRCGPAGLQFSKPIFLTISYKFDIDSTSMRMLSYQKKKSIGNYWKPLQDAVTIAQKNEVTILLNHFCDYECTGVSNSCRWVKVSVKVERIDAENCDVFVNLYNVFDEHGDCVVMEVVENGGNIYVNINEIDKSWIVTSKPIREIGIKQMWPEESNAASSSASASDTIQVIGLSVKFTARVQNKEASPVPDDFSANIDVYQHNNYRPRLNLKAVHKMSPDPEATHSDASQIAQDLTDQFLGNFFNDSPYFLSQTNYTGICMALDTATLDNQGWKSFGSEIGISRNQALDWVGIFDKQSPSAALLDFFMKDIGHYQDVVEKLKSLKKIFVKIGNHDAERFVEQEIADRVKPPKDDWRVSMDSGFSSRPQSIRSIVFSDPDLCPVFEAHV